MLMGVGESEDEDKRKEVVDSVLRVLGVEKGDVEHIRRVGRRGSNLSHKRHFRIKVANSDVRRLLLLQAARLKEDVEVRDVYVTKDYIPEQFEGCRLTIHVVVRVISILEIFI